MRLIDADVLIKQIDTEREQLAKLGMLGAEHIVTHYVRNFIEDAPTVDRPQGEWIEVDEPIMGNPYCRYRCSKCGLDEPYARDFCPNCGAQMKGIDDDNA